MILDVFIEGISHFIVFKEETNIGDSVLVLVLEQESVRRAQGLVTNIERDIKLGWWMVTIIFLFPPSRVEWLLRNEYFTGKKIFTMNGSSMWIAAIQDLKSSDHKPEKRKPFTIIEGGKNKENFEPEAS